MPNKDSSALIERARAFLADDPDPDTRQELTALIERADLPALSERFAGRLTFGTAGLRGRIGAGESFMNVSVVAQTTAGLCAHLLAAVPDAAVRGVCIGYDGRRKSREFAEETARVVTGAGIVAHLFDDVVSTPLLGFSVCHLHAAAGVMVTASHNPKDDNGYKVYWGNGAQIIPPHDTAIEAQIAAVKSVRTLSRLSLEQARERNLLRSCDGVEESYFGAISKLIGRETSAPTLSIAYTALHGVGQRFAVRALQAAGFNAPATVAEQAQPDGTFPTVAFPNPEEKGAMDLVLQLAERQRADLVLANDPDADRLAVAVRTRSGAVVQLTGNEVGVLLTDHLLETAPRDGKNLVLTSLVSTPMAGVIAAAHGARWEPTLTGFKWIANRAIELETTEGLRFVLGFEEALGYTVGDVVRDKDGVSTAAIVARMAAHHARQGRTLLDALEQLYRTHGMYRSRPASLTLRGSEGLAQMHAAMGHLRAAPPKVVGEHAVAAYTDLEHGVEVRGGQTQRAKLPQSNVLIYELRGGHRIAIRPSGTEPKIKLYVDACTQVASEEPLHAAAQRADGLADSLRAAFQALAGL